MKKIIVALSLLLLFMAGCSNAKDADNPAQPPDSPKTVTLKEVAQQEREMHKELEPLHNQVVELYGQFNSGQINRETLNSQLAAISPKIWDLVDKSKSYYEENVISESDKDNPLYDEGLKYGEKLRRYVLQVVEVPVKGQRTLNTSEKDEKGNSKVTVTQLDDAKAKAYYETEEKRYQKYVAKYMEALGKL